jgi:hypothetical protein
MRVAFAPCKIKKLKKIIDSNHHKLDTIYIDWADLCNQKNIAELMACDFQG